MPAMIVDGRAKFGVSLDTFYRQDKLVLRLARRKILIPPTSETAPDAEPALAYVNPLPDGSVRWIASCPACARHGHTQAEYVWLEKPLLFCMRCGNEDIGHKWRPVEVPKQRNQIEKLLLARPDPMTRGWEPQESLKDLREQNARLATKGGDG